MSVNVAEKLRQKSTEIRLTPNQAEVVDAAEVAVLKLSGVYVRARTLVHVVHDIGESHGLEYPTGQPVIARLGRERLREVCGKAATWLSVRSKGEKMIEVEIQCPPWVPATLLDRGEWKFPALDAISDAPVFRPDGTIHERPGYDPITRTIYEPGTVKYPPLATAPTRRDAERSLVELLDPFVDFPAVADSDRAAIAALVLTLIGRPAIGGCVPMFLARAPTPGSGKGLVIDTCAMIATGRLAPKRPPTTNEDEFRKSMFAHAIESPALVVLDNIEGSLGSPTLAYVLTAGVVSDRLLGLTENRTASVRYVIAATGNNVQLRGDTGRRVVPIDLDPGVEHPEDRKDFRYPDLLAHVRAERPRLVTAALTILRAFVVGGRPSHGFPAKGSFEAWDALVRGAVLFAGGADPLGGVKRIREEGDEDLERLRALLVSWHATFQSTPVTLADAIRRAGESSDLHDALSGYCRGGKPDSRTLGYAMKKVAGRVCSDLTDTPRMLKLAREDGRSGTCRWKVVEVGGDGGDGGDLPATRDRDLSLFVAAVESPPSQPSPPWDGDDDV